MRGIFRSLVFFALLLCASYQAKAQTYVHPYRWQTDTLIIVNQIPYRFQFPAGHLPQLQTLQIQSRHRLLRQETDYRLNNQKQILFFNLAVGDSLLISYRRQPFDLEPVYRLFVLDTVKHDTTTGPGIRLKRQTIANPFGGYQSGLQTSGSIMRGVQIGSNRDFSLNSGLNVELSGKLTNNLEVIAALTDEATPIQPEGNTQTLNEVDKVFVQFKSPMVSGTVGDFNLAYRNSEFGALSRKLQGITLTGKYKGQQVNGTVATTRGFFKHQSFLGQEGKQGPYQLTGKNNELDIIVLSGTERVWLDGKKMVRGESNDYTVEYGNGQIRFTSKQLITSASRIEVDFEYYPASQNYNRNVYGGLAATNWFNNRLKLQMQLYRESDDPNQAFNEGQDISAAEKSILRDAGDDPLQAFSSGATYLPDFSGSYLKADTTLGDSTYTYYKYVGQGAGDYALRFSDVGSGNGAYTRDRLGVYRWTGPASGNYLPLRLLALPSQQDLADIRLSWQPVNYFDVNAEYARSSLDQNILSSIDDADNDGNAMVLKAKLDGLPVGGNGAQLTAHTALRYVDKTFRAADRFRTTDYQRQWNDYAKQDNSTEEKTIQADVLYKHPAGLQLNADGGHLQRPGFASNRLHALSAFNTERTLLKAEYEYVASNQQSIDLQSGWQRLQLSAGRKWWILDPQIHFNQETRRNEATSRTTGFRFRDMEARLGLYKWHHAEGFYSYSRRYDDVYDYQQAGTLLPQAVTTTQRLTLKLLNHKSTNADLHLVHRKKDYTRRFEAIKLDTLKLLYADASVQDTVWQDRTTDLAELNIAHNAWKKAISASWQYRISSEQTALKEKVYLDVGEGRGTLRFDSTLAEYVPDADGKYLLYILPSGKFEPVTTLQSVLRLKLDGARYLKKDRDWLMALARRVSSETYFRVEEETKESNRANVYLLNLSKFQGPYTVRGSIQLNQDFYILRRNRSLSFRLRYRFRKSSSNQFLLANENEDNRTQEIGLRANWRLFGKLNGQSETRTKTLLRSSAANPIRDRDIRGWYLSQKFSYRPFRRWELGLESEYGSEENRAVSFPLSLWYGQVKSRLNYALPENGRASAEYLLQSVNITANPLSAAGVPYEMARGRKEGISQTWQVRFEYTLAKNIVFSMFYNGRNEAGFKDVIHSGQAEVRAFF